jgi:hypothetical protein
MSEIIQDTAKFLLTQSLYWASRNPLEAIAGTAIISNPTTRSLTFKIGGHLIKQNLRDLQFFSRLIYTELVAPAGRAAIPQIKRAATTPAVAIPATALAAAAVGAAISSATVVEINKQHNTSGTVWGNWSPFGGFQLGTVV